MRDEILAKSEPYREYFGGDPCFLLEAAETLKKVCLINLLLLISLVPPYFEIYLYLWLLPSCFK
jgi:hypothetical protein